MLQKKLNSLKNYFLLLYLSFRLSQATVIIFALNLNFNFWNYFPINCNWNAVLKIVCKSSIAKILRPA